MTFIVTTSAKGQVVIPSPIRKLLGVSPGQKIAVELRSDEIVLKPLPKDPIAALTGLCKGEASLTEALLQAKREEIDRETKKSARGFSATPRFA